MTYDADQPRGTPGVGRGSDLTFLGVFAGEGARAALHAPRWTRGRFVIRGRLPSPGSRGNAERRVPVDRGAPFGVGRRSAGYEAAASAACALSARSTPERDSETSRRRAAFGSAAVSQASVFARVSCDTWTAG